MKYTEVEIVFKELPGEVTLAINISNCPYKCVGCHSPHLQEDIGIELDLLKLKKLIEANPGITCIAFMGGNETEVYTYSKYIKQVKELKVAWFTGQDRFEFDTGNYLDYVKLGQFIIGKGGLDSPTTNQKLFKIEEIKLWK